MKLQVQFPPYEVWEVVTAGPARLRSTYRVALALVQELLREGTPADLRRVA